VTEIKYAVIYLFKDGTGTLEASVYEDGFTVIQEAEKARIEFLKRFDFDPQNVQVTSYKT